jgi:hypothetical protein
MYLGYVSPTGREDMRRYGDTYKEYMSPWKREHAQKEYVPKRTGGEQ